jgi:hypothetical protein
MTASYVLCSTTLLCLTDSSLKPCSCHASRLPRIRPVETAYDGVGNNDGSFVLDKHT